MKKKLLKSIVISLLAMVLFLGFSACGSTKKAESDDASAENTENADDSSQSDVADKADEDAKDLQDVSIVLDWYPNAIHAFLYNAIEKGYFAEERINLKILFPANPNDGITMPASGNADFGVYYMKDVIKARADENVPVKSIGALIQSHLNILLALEEKNINSPKDLEGKKVGYCGADLSKITVEEMVKNDGGDPSKIEFIDVGFDLMNAMTTEQVDATIDCMKNHEIPFMEKEGFKVNAIELLDYKIPQVYEMVIIAGDDTLVNKKDMVDGFIRAINKGFEDMKNDKEGSLDILLSYQNEENFPLDRDVESQSYDVLLPVMETEDAKFLEQDEKVWEKNMDWMMSLGFLKNKIDPAELIYRAE